jgi:hypothetical protein
MVYVFCSARQICSFCENVSVLDTALLFIPNFYHIYVYLFQKDYIIEYVMISIIWYSYMNYCKTACFWPENWKKNMFLFFSSFAEMWLCYWAVIGRWSSWFPQSTCKTVNSKKPGCTSLYEEMTFSAAYNNSQILLPNFCVLYIILLARAKALNDCHLRVWYQKKAILLAQI